MKKNRPKIVALLLLGFVISAAQAQQTNTATGGVALGSGGTVAYSVGQIVYTTHTGATGTVAQGVQDAYEIYFLGITETELNISLQVYPNPATDYLILKVDASTLPSNQQMTYQLFDLTGKLIENKKITSTTEVIQMENLADATYFLKVINSNNEVKTFKIIKN